MKDELTSLIILQERDLRKQEIEKDLARIPQEELHIEQTLKSQSADYEKHKLEAQQIEVARKDLDNEVKTKEALISKYQNQQLQTKKNEEYQALGHEIERARKEISDLEDRELQLMEDYDAAQADVTAEEKKVVEYREAASQRKKNLAEKQANLTRELEALEKEIADKEANCEPASLKLYRRILVSKGDAAIVKIESGNQCGGCHMTLTHQDVLTAKGGKIAHCGNCGRILFWQDEFA